MINQTISYELNGKKIVLAENDKIFVGTGYKSEKYKVKIEFKASEMGRAVFTYNCYNIANGYKKKIWVVRESGKKEVLARVITTN